MASYVITPEAPYSLHAWTGSGLTIILFLIIIHATQLIYTFYAQQNLLNQTKRGVLVDRNNEPFASFFGLIYKLPVALAALPDLVKQSSCYHGRSGILGAVYRGAAYCVRTMVGCAACRDTTFSGSTIAAAR